MGVAADTTHSWCIAGSSAPLVPGSGSGRRESSGRGSEARPEQPAAANNRMASS